MCTVKRTFKTSYFSSGLFKLEINTPGTSTALWGHIAGQILAIKPRQPSLVSFWPQGGRAYKLLVHNNIVVNILIAHTPWPLRSNIETVQLCIFFYTKHIYVDTKTIGVLLI